jgi:lycopene beta-cyclase
MTASSSGHTTDIAIIGGGLAGGLIALALRQAQPDRAVLLLEAGDRLGGNHRWSWFASDIAGDATALLAPFRTAAWPSGYSVRFPGHRRDLQTPYHSLASADFDAGLRRALGQDTIRTGARVARIARDGVQLADGTAISARVVIDCRDGADVSALTGGWQVFLGRHLRTATPHGVTQPIIMDATVEQCGGYRFVYVLPLGPNDLFVEDTYYQDSPVLDRPVLSARVDAYAAMHGWHGETVAEETGVLPVITGGDFAAYQAANRSTGVVAAGARGGFVHPLTSYTVPFAVATARAVAAEIDLAGADLAERIEARARAHWRHTRFYRLLGTMLFGAARPHERYRVFERFYRLPESLIERFYAARSTLPDKARVLCGKPPVSVSRAIGAIAGSQNSLKETA